MPRKCTRRSSERAWRLHPLRHGRMRDEEALGVAGTGERRHLLGDQVCCQSRDFPADARPLARKDRMIFFATAVSRRSRPPGKSP
jgi:hypothetical protein